MGKLSIDQMVENLRKAFGTIERIDPTGPAYTNLLKLIKKIDTKGLEVFEAENIKWLSYESRKELKLRLQKLKLGLQNI